LIFSRSFIEYSTSGLENAMTHLLLAVFFTKFFLLEEKKDIPWFALSLITSLALFNRIDTVLLYAPAWLYLLLVHRREIRWKALALGALPFLFWEIFAFIYYGFLFPNTKYAKLGTGLSLTAYL